MGGRKCKWPIGLWLLKTKYISSKEIVCKHTPEKVFLRLAKSVSDWEHGMSHGPCVSFTVIFIRMWVFLIRSLLCIHMVPRSMTIVIYFHEICRLAVFHLGKTWGNNLCKLQSGIVELCFVQGALLLWPLQVTCIIQLSQARQLPMQPLVLGDQVETIFLLVSS